MIKVLEENFKKCFLIQGNIIDADKNFHKIPVTREINTEWPHEMILN